MPEKGPREGLTTSPQTTRVASRKPVDSEIVESAERCLLRDLSRMAEPAIIADLKGQIITLREGLGLNKRGILASQRLFAKWDVFERYGLNPALCAVLSDNNPEGYMSVSVSEFGMIVRGKTQAELFLLPTITYPLLHLSLKHEDEHGKQLSYYLGHANALKVIGSPTLDNADEYLRRIWRIDAPEGITEELRNAQALIWSVSHLAYNEKLIPKSLHPHFDRDILTVKS